MSSRAALSTVRRNPRVLLKAPGWFCLLMTAGCVAAAQPDKSGVRAVTAKIDGITCSGCVPPLEASLREQFKDASAIEISDKEKIAVVRFATAHGKATPASFTQAVRRIGMKVVTLEIDACGRLDTRGEDQILVAGENRFVVRPSIEAATKQPVCIKGQVDTTTDPPILKVTSFEKQAS